MLRRLSVLFAIAAAVVMVSASTSSAAGAGAAAVIGGGNISPGLTATPTPQSGSFSGIAAGVLVSTAPAAFAGTLNCNFGFASHTVGETVANGLGTANGSCSGTDVTGGVNASVNCNAMTYARIGPVVVVVDAGCGFSVGSDGGTGPVAGGFLFAPTSAPGAPVTSYALAGAAAGAGV